MSSGVRRESSNSSAWLSTRASLPSPRLNVGSPPPPSTIPAAARIAWTCVGVELLVLGVERVDRRGDDLDLVVVEPLPHERLAGEHVGVGLLDVDAQEVPRAARDVVGLVDPDMATPDHLRARALERADQPGGLRVVEQDDVVVVDQVDELARVLLQRVLVGLARLVVERAAVAREAMELVVDPLRDLEELRVALDHRPASVDAGALRIADQREQELDDASALGGRADVPDRATVQQFARTADPGGQLLERLGLEHGLEALGRVGCDFDHFKHAVNHARARVRATPLERARTREYRLRRRPLLTTLSHIRSAASVV